MASLSLARAVDSSAVAPESLGFADLGTDAEGAGPEVEEGELWLLGRESGETLEDDTALGWSSSWCLCAMAGEQAAG